MTFRKIACALGYGGSMLAAAAFLSTAVASADPGDFDPFGFYNGGETVTGISGFPPLYQDIAGTELLGVPFNGSTAVAAGFVDADFHTFTTAGFTNTEYLITAVESQTQDVAAFPTDGSVYDFATFGGFTNEYIDLVGGTASAPTDTITDTLITPFGSLDLSPLFEGFVTSVDAPGIVFGGI